MNSRKIYTNKETIFVSALLLTQDTAKPTIFYARCTQMLEVPGVLEKMLAQGLRGHRSCARDLIDFCLYISQHYRLDDFDLCLFKNVS